jgi:ABC-2 type transport system ATP-binding protein
MDGDLATAAISASAVSKRYGSIEALTDVTVAIDGLATGLLGANGAGKSTLMRALLGLVRPDAGSLQILGLDAARDSRDIRRRVGYMPEGECLPRDPSAHVFVVHLAELRGLPRRAAVLRASEVLFQVGLEEERSRPIGTFSTGMRQRVKLAQALVHGPELVVLDEPTAGLDPAGREEMLQLVRRLSLDLGVRVLLSSHVLEDVARTCDAVVVLRDGHVVTSGLLDELRGADATAIAVRVTGDIDAFRAALARRSLIAEEVGDRLVVPGADAAALDAIRDAAAESGVGVRELAPAVPTVEDILVGAMEEV